VLLIKPSVQKREIQVAIADGSVRCTNCRELRVGARYVGNCIVQNVDGRLQQQKQRKQVVTMQLAFIEVE